jgi:FkbM family methyltransferase
VRVVVDLGCFPQNGADSIAALRKEYDPHVIYGFDPMLDGDTQTDEADGLVVILKREAAWVEDGTLLFHEDGSASRIGAYGFEVTCFDFSHWLQVYKGTDDEVFVKMDIEGAEVPVLEKMIADGTDALVDELLVEWHGKVVDGYRCPAREWWL